MNTNKKPNKKPSARDAVNCALNNLHDFFLMFKNMQEALNVLERLVNMGLLDVDENTMRILVHVLIQKKNRLFFTDEDQIGSRFEGLYNFIVENLKQEHLITMFANYVLCECDRAIEYLRDNSSCEGPIHDENMCVLRKVAEPLLGKWKDHVNLTEFGLDRVLETGIVEPCTPRLTYDDCCDELLRLEMEAALNVAREEYFRDNPHERKDEEVA